MDNSDDIMNSPQIRDILSELKGDVHIPFEFILADAEGKLSSDGHSKVASHLNICDECNNIFKHAEDFQKHAKDSDEEGGTPSSISINAALRQKLQLATTVNSKRDEVAKEIAQLLLPEDMWFSIKPSIVVYRNWLKSSVKIEVEESEPLSVAAFSGGSPKDKEDFQIVIRAVRFSDYICDLLIERCKSLNEVEQKLPEFVNDGIALFDGIELYGEARKDVLVTVKNTILSTTSQ